MAADKPRVGIVSPGDMGAGIGSVLHANGIEVLATLAGRSDLTKLRATEAGFTDAGSLDDLVAGCDILLSVLVPSEARAIAGAVAASMKRTGAAPVYVDCNAIAPQTVAGIEAIVRAAGAAFIDAGIIGSPPQPGRSGTHLHCSGPDTAAFEELGKYGLDVRVVGPRIGQASALKMVYAASTKGTTALWTELFVAARAFGLESQLMEELGESPTARQQVRSGIPSMPRRARRWIGEMEEIATTFEGLGMTPLILQGAADLYRQVGETALADQTSREPDPPFAQVIEVLAEGRGE